MCVCKVFCGRMEVKGQACLQFACYFSESFLPGRFFRAVACAAEKSLAWSCVVQSRGQLRGDREITGKDRLARHHC